MIKRTLFFGNPAYLSVRNDQLVVQLAEDKSRDPLVKTIPIEDIGVIVLESRQLTITSAAMDALLQNNCAVITCDAKHMPSGLFLPLEGNTLQSERFKAQLTASLPLRKQLWQQTVQAKIHNQASVLNRLRQEEVGCMLKWESAVKSGDSSNLEGRAAAYYWKCFFPDIEQFTRERESDAPNSLLNYGYAILRGVVARALVSTGLLPTMGIHHHNRYNAYCLADDIMEPYRPYVDELVLRIYDESPLAELTVQVKRKLLEIPVLDVVIDGKRSPLMIAVTTTTASLMKCFEGETRKLLYPLMDV